MGRPFDRMNQRQRDEMLSAYLDDQLDAEARARLEARLARDPALQAELDALRHTVSLMHDLPVQPIPRNFILPQSVASRPRPAPAVQPRRRWVAPFLTAASAVVGVFFVVVLAGDLLLSGSLQTASAPDAALEMVEQTLEVPAPVTEISPVEETPLALRAVETPDDKAGVGRETVPAASAEIESAPGADVPGTPIPSPMYGIVDDGGGEGDAEATDEAASPPAPVAGGDVEETVTPAPGPAYRTEESTPVPPPPPTTVPADGLAQDPEVVPSEEVDRTEETRDSDRGAFESYAPPLISPWRVFEIVLGAGAVGLILATVLAWRARRR